MEITRELLEFRRDDLKKQLQAAIANANAIDGALQDVEYWLEQERKEEEKKQMPMFVDLGTAAIGTTAYDPRYLERIG